MCLVYILFFLLALAHFLRAKDQICRTSECVRLSEHYRANMNTSAKPCDNFYEFACGNYAKNRSIPANQLKNVLFYDMQHEFDKELIDLFEKADFENSSYAMKQAKIFYDSCMNQMAHEHYRTAALESILNLFGGWHLLNQSTFNEATFKWEVLAGNMTMVGINPIIRPVLVVSPKNNEEFVLHLEPLRMTLLKFENYFEERANGSTAMELYEQYIPEFLQLLGVNMDKNTMILIRDIIELEKRLVKTSTCWNSRFSSYQCHQPDVLQKIERYDHKGEPRHDQYLFDVAIGEWLLHPKFQKPRDRLYWKLKGRSPHTSDIRRKCIFDVRYRFAIPLADELIRKRFKEQDRILVERMTQDIKEVMRQELQNADWMEESTRAKALKKMSNMKANLEYLDSILNDTEIQKSSSLWTQCVLANVSTWKNYKKRAQCFIDQYGKEIEPITGRNFNGLHVLGESIGDNGGLRIAYQAYLNESNRTGDFRRLPELEDYSSDQMFFIAFANTFCEVIRPESIEAILQWPYTYGATRVNIPIRNFEKFSEVFECHEESAMREKEEDRCRVW